MLPFSPVLCPSTLVCIFNIPIITYIYFLLLNPADSYGGVGFINSGSSLSLEDCTVSYNNASFGGGGLFVQASFASVSTSTLQSNAGGSGGAIYLIGSSANFSANQFISNGINSLQGGAIYASSSSFSSVHSNFSANNVSELKSHVDRQLYFVLIYS
jgi:hypothetical protein